MEKIGFDIITKGLASGALNDTDYRTHILQYSLEIKPNLMVHVSSVTEFGCVKEELIDLRVVSGFESARFIVKKEVYEMLHHTVVMVRNAERWRIRDLLGLNLG